MPSFIFVAITLALLWWWATIWCVVAYRRNEDASTMLLWLAQLSGMAVLGAFLLMLFLPEAGGLFLLIAVLLFPPIFGFGLLFHNFTLILLAVGVLLLGVFGLIKASREIAPVLSVVAMLLISSIAAGPYFDRQMCVSALKHGLSNIERPSFWHNLLRRGSKSGSEPYAIAYLNEEVWDWSYDREEFVPYPGQVPAWADMTRFSPLECRW